MCEEEFGNDFQEPRLIPVIVHGQVTCTVIAPYLSLLMSYRRD